MTVPLRAVTETFKQPMSFDINDMFSVRGMVVVITGGGTGIGKAVAAGFATNGAKVYITGRRLEVLQKTSEELNAKVESKGGRVIPVRGDVATRASAAKIAEEISALEPVVDVLINSAGVCVEWKHRIKNHSDPDDVMQALSGVEDEDFRYCQDVNVNGTFFMTTSMVPLLRQSSNPSVVVISSLQGLANQRVAMDSLVYGVSKAAAEHLGSLLAGRLHPMKIRVNTVAPGIFPSEQTGKPTNDFDYEMPPGPAKAALRSTMKRPGLPHEIVGPLILLASKAGMYMNNVHLNVDGGRLMTVGIDDGIRLPDEMYVVQG